MADLTTLANAKLWLGVTNTSDDPLLTRLVSAASQFVQEFIGRYILTAPYSFTVSGRGGFKAILPNYPVTAVSSVTVDGQAIPASTGPLSPGYTFDAYQVYLNGYAFNAGINNVTIAYTAGYATAPLDIEQACLEITGSMYRRRDRVDLISKGALGETTSYSQLDFPPTVKSVLYNYKKYIPIV